MILDKALEEYVWNFNETEEMEKIRNSAVSKALEKYRKNREEYKKSSINFNRKYSGSKAIDIHDAKKVHDDKKNMEKANERHNAINKYVNEKNREEANNDLKRNKNRLGYNKTPKMTYGRY